jgi:hypothetical protein
MRMAASASLFGVIASSFAGSSLLQAGAPSASQTRLPAQRQTQTSFLESYGRLPLHFERNQGQVESSVRFLARGHGYSLFLTPTEAVLALRQRETANAAVLRFTLVGGNRRPTVAGGGELPGRINYFVGNDPARWRTNIATYARVHYSEVYPGIDLVYYGNQQQLEYDFVVAPGANPGRIRMSFDGARDVRLDASGDLILRVAGGEIRQHRPVVYQDVQGVRQQVAGRYVMNDRRQVGFDLGAYDRSRPLVIDPVLVYSTYLGGSQNDLAHDVAVDAAGNAYVGGETSSPDFPTVSGAYSTSIVGAIDGFVTKLNPTGTTLIYSTYLGSGATDRVTGIAVDPATGHAYVTGETIQPAPGAAPFPTTPGAFDTSSNGSFDVFVSQLDSSGATLIYSTYLGGGSADRGHAIAIDTAGNAYVTGQTISALFPTTVGAFDPTLGGFDAFVTKVNASGSALLYSTFLGGSSTETGNGIAVDADGRAYVTGQTLSADFPTTAGAFDTTRDGNDAFVTKLTLAGTGPLDLVYSTYLGGSSAEVGNGIAVAGGGGAFVTGQTTSEDFPTTIAAFDVSLGGSADAFVTKVNLTGSALDYSTYLGGGNTETGTDVAVDQLLNAHVTGATASADFPTSNAVQPGPGGGGDAFVTRLDSTGSALVESTYIGGSGADSGNGIAVDSASYSYVAGVTQSADFPTTAGAYDTDGTTIGLEEAFVVKIGGAVPTSVTLDPRTDINPVGTEHCVVATVRDAAGNPVPDTMVRFTVMGAVSTSGSDTTDAGGEAQFCYDGPVIPGADAIWAFADVDGDGTHDAEEPGGPAAKTWVAGAPATLTLTPAEATNPVGAQHCVTAAARDAFGNPTPGITVRFAVTGAVNTTGSAPTDGTGDATFCYQGPRLTGTDVIAAYADADADGTPDAGEPGGAATKTWVAAAPATLTLTPATATNPVGGEHCVTAAVTDAFGNATPGITVRFTVGGAVNTTGSAPTDATGRATLCYRSPLLTGTDAITAYADVDQDGTQDAGEPGGEAAKTWVAAPPATLTLTPGSASNPIGTQHCVMAAVSDAFGNPTPDITVRFRVTGAVNTTGSTTTEADGRAIFCYEGPLIPGADHIAAYADADGDAVQDPGEPGGTAAKEWTLPVSAGCKVTGGGYITTSSGSRATFGGATQSIEGVARGIQAYVDHGSDRAPKVLLHSQEIDSVVCEGTTATIYGRGRVHRYGTVEYRIRVTDGAQDTYSITLSNGYASGEKVVMGGSIRIH